VQRVDAGNDFLLWILDPDCYPPSGTWGCCKVFNFGEWRYEQEPITVY